MKTTELEQSTLQRHKGSLLEEVNAVFGYELSQNHPLPFLKCRGLDSTPDLFTVSLIAPSEWDRKTVLFTEEMFTTWLVPGKQLRLLSSRNFLFKLPYSSSPLFFIELLIHVPDASTLQVIQENLPSIIESVKLGVTSPGHARHILEMKRLALSDNTAFIYETVADLIRRYPKRFSHDIFRNVQHFLAQCHKDFHQIRNHRHLCRIIFAHYLFERALEKDVKVFPHTRHLYLKLIRTLLHYPFGLKKVLGLAISLNTLQDYETFELRHILKAVQRLLPDVRALQDSYYAHRSDENHLQTLYIEVEKSSGGDFTLEEIKRLKEELPEELKNSIEYLSPSLFIPRNEEELIRNIISLSQELRYVRDLPQAMISFQEQHYEVLRFNVILLRILKDKSRSLTKLSRQLPSEVNFLPERVANVGYLRKKHIKEANVFTIELKTAPFLRKNHSVDLVKARQSVVKAVEKMVGTFRDYNGGFLLKQNEQLEVIKEALGSAAKQHAFLLENLFYSLTPSILQTYIPAEKGKMLCALFLEMLNLELPNNDECLQRAVQEHDALAIVIKTSHTGIKEEVAKALKHLKIDSLQLASSSVEVDRHHYQCYLYLNATPDDATLFQQKLDQAIANWIAKRQNLQVLRISLPRAAQSLDPRLGVDRNSGMVIKMLYEGLMRISESGDVEPAIAESYTASEDNKKFCFTLRQSRWSNGTPLTAYDFEYAWKKILEPDFRCHYAFLFFPIKNADEIKRGEKPMSELGLYAPDAHTLCIELEYPFPNFPALTTSWMYSPLCREIDQKHPGWAYHSGDTYVCNGPFKLDNWKLSDDLQAVKNPLYWDAPSVRLDRIEVGIIEYEKMTLDLFARGELDWVGDPISKIPPKEVIALRKKYPILTADKTYGLFWLQFNCDQLPWQSAAMRRAFAAAIDREILIKQIMHSEDIPAYGFSNKIPPLPPQIPQEDPLELFQQGLEELALDANDFPTIVITHSDIEEHEEVTHEIGRQWEKRLGIKVRYERILWDAYFEALHRGEIMVGALTWYPRFDHPSYFYDRFIYREHTVRTTTWKNTHYAQLIQQAKYSEDCKEAEMLYKKAEEILLDQMPAVPLFYQKFRYIKNPRLKGYILSNTNQIDLRAAYLEHTGEKP